jgi:hypothetical protein
MCNEVYSLVMFREKGDKDSVNFRLHIKQLITLGSMLKITEVAHLLGILSPMEKLCINFRTMV